MSKQPEEPQKVDLKSMDLAEARRAELLRLFPEVGTEGGKVDFERLKLTLGEAVDVGRERYGMTWPGKADCFKTVQSPSLGTLRPVPQESLNFDKTKNLIIEGDNLEVLKLLQKSYLNKVKTIYIDPPYNTGNDFIYPDNYSENLQTYLEYTGQVDGEGLKFGTNTDADGRFHSKWLNMIFPRLYLARNLLKEDGVIFVSIDDSEQVNLKRALDEVFGEENFVTAIAWQKKVSPANDAKWFSGDHEWILLYAKNKSLWRPDRLPMNERQQSYYQNPDNDPRGPWNSATYTCGKTSDERPNLYYAIKNPNTGEEIWPSKTAVWKYSLDLHNANVAENKLYWGKDGRSTKPRFKTFLNEAEKIVPRSVWLHAEVGSTQSATQALADLIPEVDFDTPKPPSLIKRMLQVSARANGEEVVLDFFAGSGTTAQAVLEQNKFDGGNRRFILIQLPEPANRAGFSTIADITKERVRRVAKILNEENEGQLDFEAGQEHDRGFKVFKLAESNFKTWDGASTENKGALEDQLELHSSHLREGRTDQDMLFELLLKSGFEPTTPIEVISVSAKTVYSIASGSLFICLERELTVELIRAMADKKPERVVCLDAGFAGNDQLKANAVQLFKTKGVNSFRTV